MHLFSPRFFSVYICELNIRSLSRESCAGWIDWTKEKKNAKVSADDHDDGGWRKRESAVFLCPSWKFAEGMMSRLDERCGGCFFGKGKKGFFKHVLNNLEHIQWIACLVSFYASTSVLWQMAFDRRLFLSLVHTHPSIYGHKWICINDAWRAFMLARLYP